jgi:hypothetical protein
MKTMQKQFNNTDIPPPPLIPQKARAKYSTLPVATASHHWKKVHCSSRGFEQTKKSRPLLGPSWEGIDNELYVPQTDQ